MNRERARCVNEPAEVASRSGVRIGDDALRFERHLAASVDRVWIAITTPEAIAQWLGRPGVIEQRPGGTFEIRFNAEDGMNGRILTYEPQRRLVLAWREQTNGEPARHATRDDDESLVSFELAPAPSGGTTLIFTHRYIRPGEAMAGFGGGWHAHLDSLEALLDGKALPDRVALYERVLPSYQARLGG